MAPNTVSATAGQCSLFSSSTARAQSFSKVDYNTLVVMVDMMLANIYLFQQRKEIQEYLIPVTIIVSH